MRFSIAAKFVTLIASGAFGLTGLLSTLGDDLKADRPAAGGADAVRRLSVESVTPVSGSAYPAGTKRITYTSAFDGAADWALFLPSDPHRNTVVYLHGSFAEADQIFTRKDIRDFWLTRIREGGHGLLSVNLRGTSYMSPAATADLTDLLAYCKDNLGCERFVLLGGSGGASSAMAYAVLHPEKVHGVMAMGMCDILQRLDFARKSNNQVLQKLAATVFAAYGGSPEEKPELYQARSVLAHIDRLTMPVILTMGEADALIPVAETRKIAAAMKGKSNFVYHEIPKGSHDSALWVDIDLETFQVRKSSASPEGLDQPLSARYPGDVGLTGDRAVLLFEDFESGELSKARWSFAVPKAGIATAPQPVHGGQRSLHIPYDLPEGPPAHRDCNRMVMANLTEKQLDHFFVRGYVNLASTPTPTAQRKLFYIFSHPRGEGQWDVIVSAWCKDTVTGDVPKLCILSNFFPYSDLRMPAWNLAPVPYDTWHCLEVEVKLNTPPDRKDGWVRLWLDDKLIFEKTGVALRKDGRPLGEVGIGYQIDRNGDTRARHEDRYWDDLVIATNRIGAKVSHSK